MSLIQAFILISHDFDIAMATIWLICATTTTHNDGNEIGFAHRAIKVNCHVAPEWKEDVLNGRISATSLKLLVHPKFLDANPDAGWNEMFDWEQAIFVRSVFGDNLAKLVAMQRKR